MFENIKNKIYNEFAKVIKEMTACQETSMISMRDKEEKLFAVLSGSDIASLKMEDIVIVGEDGKILFGDQDKLDARFAIHKMIYEANAAVTVVVQPESRWVSIWASTGFSLPPISVLHAKNFCGEILCTKSIDFSRSDDIYQDIGKITLQTFERRGVANEGAIFMRNIGALVWGQQIEKVAQKTIALEELCFRAVQVRSVNDGQFCYMPYELSSQLKEN